MKSINFSTKLASEISWLSYSLWGPLLLPGNFKTNQCNKTESRSFLTLLNCFMYSLPNVQWKLYLEPRRYAKINISKIYILFFESDYYLRDGDIEKNTFVKGQLINMSNMTLALDTIEPITSWTQGGRSIHWATKTPGEQVHMWQASCILLGSALSKSSPVVTNMVNVMLGNEMWKANTSILHFLRAYNNGNFLVPYMPYWAAKNKTGDNVLELVSLKGEKRIQATPTKQHLGIF